MTAVKEPAVHTWRQRYRIECRTCNVVLHDATTGPRAHARQHLQSAG